jgi:hypothetical protein
MKPLTREQTAGTLTFYFPFERDAETPPQTTLMVRRIAENEWHAGLAICGGGDMFSKKIGRKIAFHRLAAIPFRDQSVPGLLHQICERVEDVAYRHATDDSFLVSIVPHRDESLRLVQRLEEMQVA